MPGLRVGLAGRMPVIGANIGRMLYPQDSVNSSSFSYQVQIGVAQTIKVKFTFLDNAPRARVDFGDAQSTQEVISGLFLYHNYAIPGIYTIRLIGGSQESYLAEIDVSSEPLIIPLSWPILADLSALIKLTDPWAIGYGEVGDFKIAR